jgi:transcriptional regulator with XRE-family HTH domain
MDADFLRAVQRAQWLIKAADEGSVIARCPRAGCTLTVRLSPGGVIPQTCRTGPDFLETVIRSFEDIRLPLREAREDYGLTIADVEQASGMADYHLAKCEKDDPSKIPNIETVISWAGSLGYDVILRRGSLPLLTLRLIVETRPRLKRRVQRNRSSRARREV